MIIDNNTFIDVDKIKKLYVTRPIFIGLVFIISTKLFRIVLTKRYIILINLQLNSLLR